MTRRKQLIQVHFQNMKVVRDPDKLYGSGIFDTKELGALPHRVLATFMYCFGPGEYEPAFLLETPDHRIIQKACDRFKVHTIS